MVMNPTADGAARRAVKTALQPYARTVAHTAAVLRQQRRTCRAAPSAVGCVPVNKKTGAFQFPRTGHHQLPG